jgi:hypothetical protein
VRNAIQDELHRWRNLDLETPLAAQAEALEQAGAPLPLDPRTQAAWFALDPQTGQRLRLLQGAPLRPGWWLSPGAALRPLMQSLLLPVTHAVLGPSERAYWRLAEPLWERVGLVPPELVPRPSVMVLPKGLCLDPGHLEELREGRWEAFAPRPQELPSSRLGQPLPDPAWGEALGGRFQRELGRVRARMGKLDRRLLRNLAAAELGMDPERLRQRLFPFGAPQERVLPGILWLRDQALLDRMLAGLDGSQPLLLLEES